MKVTYCKLGFYEQFLDGDNDQDDGDKNTDGLDLDLNFGFHFFETKHAPKIHRQFFQSMVVFYYDPKKVTCDKRNSHAFQ